MIYERFNMAPAAATEQAAPLADYFFIAGIESTQVFDEKLQPNGTPTTQVDEVIQENAVLETDTARPRTPEGLSGIEASRSRARFSYEARKSISSLLGSESKTASNRSSATIRGAQVGGSGLSDADFDVALRKFASERENFLEEIQFSAGALSNAARPKKRPQTQRIISDETTSGLKSGVGSIRRRLSTMSSMKRQPSVMRQSSIRTAKRLSGYNSVIPSPQPFQVDSTMHPLKRRYEPVLLDRYPPKHMVSALQKRDPFPDYVPMFAFPNDVNVVSADERPRSTWHGFAMTNADGSKMYGITLIIWLPLNQSAAEELERRCEEWRRANMAPEERELAGSLGERLAVERAKLSRLLAQLPTLSQGSLERENLEDEIGAVEEKIALMADLLRPVRHGAAAKIDGLTDGETGLWIPRAYGVLGRDAGMTSFWKEWLRAVAVPMSNGAVLRVPASSPKVGMWQPLERYVVNLCAEALSPISSITQVEINVRELRLYARKDASNELPLSRNTDLYALFRALAIPNIVTLLEYVLAESRIILYSSHASMLHLASAAITSLIYPMKWSGVFIPVLPARLIQAVEAPCPYIVGIEKRYENVEFPDDDFVLVDLDENIIESTGPPTLLPRQQRRKLMSLLQVAAQHHNRCGVPTGPPAYAVESYPYDSFSSEHPSIYSHRAPASQLATLAGLSSTHFGNLDNLYCFRAPILNAFLQARNDQSRGSELQRPATSSTGSNSRLTSPPSPKMSPISGHFPCPGTPVSRSDSGLALQQNLREKRSGLFDTASRRSSSFGFDRAPTTVRRPSQPFMGHIPTASSSTLGSDFRSGSSYAPSVYAMSTLAASTIMPNVSMQPVRNTENTQWVEGHCLHWKPFDERSTCSVCEDKADDGLYWCTGCSISSHARCMPQITLVCPSAFNPDQVRAAFVRCFASLFYTYRRFLVPANSEQKKNGMKYKFNMEGFLKSMPHEQADYVHMLQETQAFNEFVHERETIDPSDGRIRLFDQIIVSKKNRGRTSWLSKRSTDFLSDTSDHLWRTAAATPPSSRFPGDYRQVISRIPAKLDPALMKEPRAIQGVARLPPAKAKRRPVPSMLASSIIT